MKAKRIVLVWSCLLAAGVLLPSAHPASPVIISEFMAKNSSSLTDEDNEHSDWIELHNVSNRTVGLDGWFLTDTTNSLARWRIPETNLVANGYLVIFASGKNRSVAGLPLHTNFQLDAQGEYLALVMPDGVTIATEFAPAYPEQFDDTSYGMGMNVATAKLIAAAAPARFLIPLDGSTETNWLALSFNDTAWKSGRTGLGFASSSSPSANGLYAYWPIEEGAGNVASNLVAGGADGILHGAAWVTDDPARGTVLSFNGKDSYVSAGTIPRMGLAATNFTWSFWYRQNSVPNSNAVILGNRSGGAPGGLQFIKFTPTNFEFYHDGDIGFIPHTIASGDWLHLAVAKQGPSLSYYENGVLIGTSNAAADIEANPFYWGGDPGAAGECADGLIDDVSLWTTALTADQIRLLSQGVSPSSLNSLDGFVTTDLRDQMLGLNASAYIRIPFAAPPGAAFSSLKLRVQFDDGFVAYLNGVEVARRNAPVPLGWDSSATAEHPVSAASVFEEIDLSAGLGALTTGANVLAIQALNLSAADPDFLILPELEAAEETAVGWRYLDQPTPGTANDNGFLGFVADTKFDHHRGFYDAPFTVAIACATPEATIRYTTNGTEPSLENGTTYAAPVPINGTTVLRAGAFKSGYRSKPTEAQTYLFVDQVLMQTGAGLPTDWGNDWRMDPRVMTNSAYAGRIRTDLKSLPVVSIALDPMDFWGPSGIYTQTGDRGPASERPCSVEMFFPDGSRDGFQINCGIQIVGSASRFMSPKHGIGLTFKSEYGPAKLQYRFFDDSPVEEFNFIAFRPNFNMSWVRTDNSGPLNNGNADGAERLHAIYVRDQFTKESQLAMGEVSAHERFVHLYINGMYWGVYNPSERNDAAFAASYYGGAKEEYDAIFSDPSTIARAHDGDKNAWNEMMMIARQGLASADAYAHIQQYADVTNLADYMMLNFYCATVDWPWQNWNAARKREAGAQFHFFVWDAEYTLETPPWVPDDRTGVGSGPDEADSPARLYYELRKNPEWRLLFADRVHQHFFNDGALTTNQTMPRFLRLCDAIDSAIVGESARWGDVVRKSQPYTRNTEWLTEKNRLLTQFFPQRTVRVVQQFIKAGLYPDLAAPEFSQPGGAFSNSFQLTMAAPSGVIYFTTNGLDPRLPGGALAPAAIPYLGSVMISRSQQILARARQNDAWSALSAASFTRSNTTPALAVRMADSMVVVSWLAEVKDFILESCETLSSPQWKPVEGAVDNQVTIKPSERSQFFRLGKP